MKIFSAVPLFQEICVLHFEAQLSLNRVRTPHSLDEFILKESMAERVRTLGQVRGLFKDHIEEQLNDRSV